MNNNNNNNTWTVKSNVITVIMGATGTTSNSFRKYLSNISGAHEVKNYKKQSYWTRQCKSTVDLTLEIALHAP